MGDLIPITNITKTSKGQLYSAAVGLLILGLLVFLILGRDQSPPPVAEPEAKPPPKGFTFFNIGSDMRLDRVLQERLETELGSAVTERWANLDMSVNYLGFLDDHFPKLAELNILLKKEAPLRPKENPIRLTFRHTRRKATLFERVDLVFSSYSRKPIFFRIKPKKSEGAAVVAVIEDKYGPPDRQIQWDDDISWDGRKGETRVWKYENDLLLISVSPDRYGDPSFLIAIYYMDNLEKTADIKAENLSQDQNSGVESAF